ncbi:hypothetical protein HanHA89_Chr13g0513951 [Helianthus annuus]|nr:hypothetical protein HanHA89_Chr13g0513951 [Helianthus annuus]
MMANQSLKSQGSNRKNQRLKIWCRRGSRDARPKGGGGGSFASREGLCGRFSFAPCLPLHSNRLNAAAWAPPTCFRAIRDTC